MSTSTTERAAEVAASFDGARLTLARRLAGLGKSDLAALVDRGAAMVGAWEAGARHPTAATVAQLALSLAVDPGFFRNRPDDVTASCSTPHFRSLRSTSQIARDQAFAYGQLAIDIANGLERYVEFPSPDVPTQPVSPEDRAGPEHAANLVRKEWGIESGPVGHLVRLMENHGVLVVFGPQRNASIDAYSFDSRLRPAIVLESLQRDRCRQRFDIAHELGHLVMHGDAEPGGYIAEDQAYRFAAELLLPADQIRDLLPATMGGNAWKSLARLEEQWGVSIRALLHRARSLGRLSAASCRNVMAKASSRGWRRDESGPADAVEQPSLLPRALELLDQEGIDEAQLVARCRVPAGLFRTITARTPGHGWSGSGSVSDEPRDRGRVVSLLERTRSRPSHSS